MSPLTQPRTERGRYMAASFDSYGPTFPFTRADILAIETEVSALDVERLAEAWGNVMDGRRITGRMEDVRIGPGTTTPEDWVSIAAEYARLQNPEPR